MSMVTRCRNPKTVGWDNYGGRGITIKDPRWWKFPPFYADMGPCPKGMTIERIDYDRGYCLENCEWADRTQQNRNTRRNHIVEYQGEKMCLSEACERSGESYDKIKRRIYLYGCTFEDAIGDILFVKKRWTDEFFNKKLDALFDKLKARPDDSASHVLIFP
jgi:hypothetical protein